MKIATALPQDQVYWYLNKQDVQPLRKDITTDVVVIGGGMAGLSAAQAFRKRGCSVVLLEKNFCGSGASGKSSGFITPNSELSLEMLIKLHGVEKAKKLWEFVSSGVSLIQNNINQFELSCDYQPQDTLVVASSSRAFNKEIVSEHKARQQLEYESVLYTQDQLNHAIMAQGYHGGISYGGSFGIQASLYCAGMKRVLQEQGVAIFEETPMVEIAQNVIKTPEATVRAKHIVVCTDHQEINLDSLKSKVYHVQTHLMMSAPLSEQQVAQIFPEKPFMAWDTELIYHYYRLTGDRRFMLGGSTIFDTYATQERHNNTRVINHLVRYARKRFPQVSLQFEYVWPGLIGVSKDLVPLAGHDVKMSSVYYITAATGLPWAAALGAYSAERIIDGRTDFDDHFSLYRSFTLGATAQAILGTRLTFALSHFLAAGSV